MIFGQDNLLLPLFLLSCYTDMIGFFRKLACKVAFIFIQSKAIFHKNAMGARPRAKPCNNFGETEEVGDLESLFRNFEVFILFKLHDLS